MISRLRDLYRGILWLAVLSAVVLPVVVSTQPASYTDGLTLSVVLTAAFFIVVGAVSWLGMAVRRRRAVQVGETPVLTASLRQALVAGIVVVSLLILQLIRVITPVDAALLALLGIVVDLYLGSRKDALL